MPRLPCALSSAAAWCSRCSARMPSCHTLDSLPVPGPCPARLPFRAGSCTPAHLDGTGKKTKKVVANLGSSRIAPFLEQSIVTNGVNSFSAPPPVCAPQYLAQRRASHVAAAPAADASPTFIATDPVRVRKPAADFGESCGCDSEFDSQPTLGVNVPAPEQGAERCGPTKGFEH